MTERAMTLGAIALLGEVLPDLLLHLDAQGLLLGVHTARQLKGPHPLLQFVGLPLLEVMHTLVPWVTPEMQVRVAQTVHGAIASRQSHQTHFSMRWPTAEGPMYHFELRAFPFFEEMLLVVRDQTTERQREEQLIISERMASLGTLAAGMAHEINNPLTYIQCNLVMAIDDLEQLRPSPEQQEALEDVLHGLRSALDGTERVAKITRELNYFARVEELRLREVDLHEVLESAFALSMNALRHRVALERDLPRGLPRVLADPQQLMQVLVNLLLNAAQAFDDFEVARPTIWVSTRLVADERVELQVRDNGVGMSEEVLRRIFDPFFTTKKARGTGLGLSVSHRIVQGLGGSVDVSSAPGEGTRVSVLLPCIQNSTFGSEISSVSEEGERAALEVLVVEDDPALCRLLTRMLPSHHLTVVETVAEAITLLTEARPDAILCDVMLPVQGGDFLHDHLRTQMPELLDRVIFMTGGTFDTRHLPFLELPEVRLLQKPFGARKLIAYIEEITTPR